MNYNAPKNSRLEHTETAEQRPDLEARQLELEAEMVAKGAETYDKQRERLSEADTAPGRNLLRKALPELVSAIREQARSTCTGRGGHLHPCKKLACGVDEWHLQPESVAVLTLRTALQTLDDDEAPGLTSLAHSLGELIRESRLWESSEQRQVNSAQEELDWSNKEMTALGAWLLELAAVRTCLFELPAERMEGRPAFMEQKVLRVREDLEDWLEADHERRRLLVPKYWPMMVPPRPWTTPRDGGYLRRRVPLIKHARRDYLDFVATHDGIQREPLTRVYTAVNAIQRVPWRINRRIFDLMQQARKSAPTEAKLLELKLTIAEKFVAYERIYFPHQLDWRGRIYPVPGVINPIVDDAGRALLEFANGKPLGDDGVKWLKVHIANLCGVGGTLANRHRWVEEHSIELLDYASNPFAERRPWCKRKKRWRILAAAFEWAGYCTNGPDHICHLPVSVDGTCNGLQHLSAMVRDAKGGRATNLLPSEEPQDLYRQVAESVKAKVNASSQPELSWWRDQRIDRELLKPAVMTTPYAVTKGTMREQLQEILKDNGVSGNHRKDCQALVPVIREAIAEAVPSAIKVMDCLQSLGRTLWTVDRRHVHWMSPAGFPVHQVEPETEIIKVTYTPPHKKKPNKLNLHSDVPGSIDPTQHRQGIVANFVHSMDAAHLMSTVNRLLKEGVTDFTFVHDSYGTHPADMPILNRCLREAFVRQYSQDVLRQFATSVALDQWAERGYDELVEREIDWGDGSPVHTDVTYVHVPVEPPIKVQQAREAFKIPEPEEQFDIREVLESEYFFV